MTLQSLLVDLAAGADSWKRACRVVAVANLTLSGEQTIDSVAVVEGERVLATAQTLTQNNGPWVVQLGAWTRPADFDASSKVVFGARCMVTSGTVYAGTSWAMTSPVSGTPVLGVTGLTWTVNEPGEFTAELAAVYTHAAGVASIKPATSTFVRGTSQGGILVTPGADDAAVTLAGKNADGTTTKPVAFELGSGGDISNGLVLKDGGAPFLSLRRWTPGAENECQFIGGTLDGAITEHFLFVSTKFVVQPVTGGDIEFNGPLDVYLSHGLGRDIFHREAMDLVGGQPFTVIREHLDLDGATLFELADGPTSFSITGVQDTVGAGMPFTFRAPKGKAGSVGGTCEIGGGDGGTAGTNAPGLCSVNSGTPVSNASGKFALAHEGGTKWLEFQQTAALVSTISGGPTAAETHTLIVRGTAVNVESSADHIALTPNGDLYLGHGGASSCLLRDGGVLTLTLKLVDDGVTYINAASTVTAVELRHNAAARVAYDANDASLIGGTSTELRVESGAQVLLDNEGVEHRRIYVAPFVEKTNDTIATVLNTGVLVDGVYECEGVFVLTNNTDNEGATYRRFASFKVVSGTISQIGTTDAGGYVDKADAGQGGATATIDSTSGVVRMRFTPPGGNTDTLRIMPTLIVHRIDLA